jgi:acetoin utilization protein AcuB
MTRVNQLMSRRVVTIGTEASCHDAVALMARDRIRHLPVVDSAGRLAGIVTDRDLRHQLFQPEVFEAIGTVPVERLLDNTPVREVMSTPAIHIAGDADLGEAAGLMRQAGIGALPVVEQGKIVGIVTETDLLRRIVGDDATCAQCEAIVVSFP